MTSAIGTLDGKPILGSSIARWTFHPGTQPYIGTFDMTPGDADSVLSGVRPITLVMQTRDAARLEVRNLYALERAPGPNPEIARVRVADRRWFWNRKHVLRRYNMRRHVSVKRLRADDLDVLAPVVEDVWYAPFSLRGGLSSSPPWRADEILSDVLQYVDPTASRQIHEEISYRLHDYPVENLELDDPGDEAIGRVLSYLPEAAITISASGSIVVYSRTTGIDEAAIQDAGPETMGGGHVEVVSYKNTRPKEVHVLFTRECEVRFDFEEPASTGGTVSRGAEDRFIENVVPIPDFTLNVPGIGEVSQGTWITFALALSAWNTDSPLPVFGNLDYQQIRKAFVPFIDMWGPIVLAGTAQPRADWASRVAAIQQHFRQTYRINRRWMDRILVLNAYRVATIDPETGTRAPATAYADYCVLGTQRTMFAELAAGGTPSYASNVSAYPADGSIGDDTRPAPARVSILDHDQGIVHLEWLADRFRLSDLILPSQMDYSGGSIPQADPTNRKQPIAFNCIGPGHGYPQLSASHKVAMILTAIPGAPNDERQLHRIVRRPSDVAKVLPEAMRRGLQDAQGPIVEVRIGSAIETARVAWSDRHANEIDRAFGAKDGTPKLDALTLNAGSQQQAGERGASLDAIATAAAARVYASFADRPVGAKTVRLSSATQLVGWIESLSHEIATDGVVSTRIELAAKTAVLNILSLMPASVRRQILKTAQPGK